MTKQIRWKICSSLNFKSVFIRCQGRKPLQCSIVPSSLDLFVWCMYKYPPLFVFLCVYVTLFLLFSFILLHPLSLSLFLCLCLSYLPFSFYHSVSFSSVPLCFYVCFSFSLSIYYVLPNVLKYFCEFCLVQR